MESPESEEQLKKLSMGALGWLVTKEVGQLKTEMMMSSLFKEPSPSLVCAKNDPSTTTTTCKNFEENSPFCALLPQHNSLLRCCFLRIWASQTWRMM